MHQNLRYLAIPVLFASLAGLTACKEPVVVEELPRTVWTIKVGQPEALKSRQLPGRAKATQQVDLSFEVSGALIERPVDLGSEVKAGDVIAKLDPRDFQSRVKSTRATLTNARKNFERAEELLKKDFISKLEYDRLEAAVDVSEADYDLAQKALADSVITAPFDGKISNLYIENFQSVQAKMPIARLLDNSQIELVVQITERMIPNVPFVKSLTVTFDAFPDLELEATIKEIGTEASQTTRTYPVTLIMEQPEDVEILAGMAGTAKPTGMLPVEGDNLIIVPMSSIFTPDDSKQDSVWIVDPDKKQVSLTPITIGDLTPAGVEVVEGLEPGQLIALKGVHYLEEGQQVEIHQVDGE